MWRCKHTPLCRRRTPSAQQGDPITWAAIGSERKCRQWLAHTSVPRRRTDACFSQLTLLRIHIHTHTLPWRAQVYLWTCSVNLKVPAGPWCVDMFVYMLVYMCVCVWEVFAFTVYLNVTKPCMCSHDESGRKLTKYKLVKLCITGTQFP